MLIFFTNQVRHICMPAIGCGLDLLQWHAVSTLIKNVFQHEDIAITVYLWGDDPMPRGTPGRSTPGSSPRKKEKKQASQASPVKQPRIVDMFGKNPGGRKRKQEEHERNEPPKKVRLLSQCHLGLILCSQDMMMPSV